MMDKKEQTRLRVQRYRDKQKSVTDVTLDVTQKIPTDRLFAPSKFLSEEEDLKVEASVRERISRMSGAEMSALAGLANGFTPNQAQTKVRLLDTT